MCIRVAVVGIHYSAGVTCCKLSLSRRNDRQWINSKAPGGKPDVGAGYKVGASIVRSGTSYGKHSGKDCRIDLLNHEERNVQERLAVVESIAATQNMLSSPGHVPGKAHPGTKVTTVVMRQRSRGEMINCL